MIVISNSVKPEVWGPQDFSVYCKIKGRTSRIVISLVHDLLHDRKREFINDFVLRVPRETAERL